MLSEAQVKDDLERMGNTVSVSREGSETVYTVQPAPYRNDFLHEVDVIEDVMIGQGLDFFLPGDPGRLHVRGRHERPEDLQGRT